VALPAGALHLWRRDGSGRWAPRHALGGHFGPVVDAAWGLDGRCLMTASVDQTARVWTDVGGAWCELARSQVHGHDFSCLAPLPAPEGGRGGAGAGATDAASAPEPPPFVYASGSEEKVLRVFEAPGAFLDTLALARGRAPAAGGAPRGALLLRPSAAVAALGLSNKAVYEGEAAVTDGGGAGGLLGGGGGGEYADGPDLLPSAAPAAVAGPPHEEHLACNTLWPEVRKLYGHGTDVVALAADPRGRYLASSAGAKSAASAAVWLWRASDWAPAAQLAGHGLTVTALAFSPCGRMLATASRDRGFCVFSVPEDAPRQAPAAATAGGAAAAGGCVLLRRVRAAHARILWGVAWAPDSALLATCSRDGGVKLWAAPPPGGPPDAPDAKPPAPALALPPFPCSVTAVAFAGAPPPAAAGSSGRAGGGDASPPPAVPGPRWLAVGLEDGNVSLWRVELDAAGVATSAAPAWASDEFSRHGGAVRRLAWRPPLAGEGPQEQLLASVGEDQRVSVARVRFPGGGG